MTFLRTLLLALFIGLVIGWWHSRAVSGQPRILFVASMVLIVILAAGVGLVHEQLAEAQQAKRANGESPWLFTICSWLFWVLVVPLAVGSMSWFVISFAERHHIFR